MPNFQQLYREIDQWGEQTHSILGELSAEEILDDLHFHSLLRFGDFSQFEELEGSYGLKLKNFLFNLSGHKDRAALLKLAEQISFIDHKQKDSLYREALRKQIIPWLEDRIFADVSILSGPKHHEEWFQKSQFLSITESFDYPRFSQVNNLDGIRKPIIIGELKNIPQFSKKCEHIIIQEDFVGTGNQALKAIDKILPTVPDQANILFCPSVILEGAIEYLKDQLKQRGVDFLYCFSVAKKGSVPENAQADENRWQRHLRKLVVNTADRVLETGEKEKLAFKEFGYGELGALVVTPHNVPNNSLPLIFRKTSSWSPLFRRREAIYDIRDETLRS